MVASTQNLDNAATTMALSVLVSRMRTLSKEDREDLLELSKSLFKAETPEEEESATLAMLEILDQAPLVVRKMDIPKGTGRLEKWMQFVSGKIRAERKKANLTQAELAERSGLPQSHISRLERAVHSPSHVTLEKIARALKIPISNLDPSS